MYRYRDDNTLGLVTLDKLYCFYKYDFEYNNTYFNSSVIEELSLIPSFYLEQNSCKYLINEFPERNILLTEIINEFKPRISNERKRKRQDITDIDEQLNKKKKETDNIDKCPICLDEMTNDITILNKCGHKLHSECLTEYKKVNNKPYICPVCRGTIIDG